MADKKTSAKGSQKRNTTDSTRRKKSTPPKSSRAKTAAPRNPQRMAVLYFVIAAFLLCLVIIKGQNVWSAIRGFVFGVFGFSSVLLPIFFGYLTYLTASEKTLSHKNIKVWLSVGIILMIDILFFLIDTASNGLQVGYFATLGELYKTCYAAAGPFSCNGGVISGILGYPLLSACGRSAAIAVDVILLIAFILLITGISIADVFRVAKKPVNAVANRIRNNNAKRSDKARENGGEPYDKYDNDYDNDNNYDYDGPPLFKANYRNSSIDIELDPPKKENSDNPEADISNGVEIISDDEDNTSAVSPAEEAINALIMNSGDSDKDEIDDSIRNIPIQHYKAPEKSKKSEKAEKTEFEIIDDIEDDEADDIDNQEFSVPKEEKTPEQKAMELNYQYPPVQLLRPSSAQDDIGAMNELQGNATKLINTLKSFGVGANIINICRGPSVTRYEIQPAPGVKISKITNLADDIALNLAADGVRIEAPIPGKAAVGIEVPNKMVTMVSMRELIDSPEFRKGESKLTSVLGKDISGNIICADLSAMPHLLIAGTTGSGKSVCVNSILLSILYKARPDEVKLLLIDPKMVEFSKYKGIPHLLVPVVSDAKKAAGALNWAVSEMLQRYKMFSEFDCKNIHAFNQLVQSNQEYILENSEDGDDVCMEVNGLPVPKEKMPQIVIAIDELADLMMAAPSEVEESICRLAQMARAAGMHLVIATQRPSVNVITGVIKANIPSRISLKVSSQIDSRTILDFGGAEKLIGRGDMLFSPVGAAKPMRVQGCYASDEEIENVTNYIKKNYNTQYNADIEEKIRRIAAEDINVGKGKKSSDDSSAAENELDSKMEEAIRCVIEAGQASTSMLQRKIKVGYARAGRMIDDMEQMGIVGPYQGSKPRDLLMTYNDWLERNNILGDSLKFDNSDEE